MFRSPNASPEWEQNIDSYSKQLESAFAPSAGLQLQEKINSLCITQPNSVSDEFQARNSVTKVQHASTSPPKAEKPESRDSTPKSQIVIPRLKLPLSNHDVSEQYQPH